MGAVIGHRIIFGDLQLILKYQGFDNTFNTYESVTRLEGAKDMVIDYLQSIGRAYSDSFFSKRESDLHVDDSGEDYRNFCYDFEVLMYVSQYRGYLKLPETIRVEQYPGKRKADSESSDVLYLLTR